MKLGKKKLELISELYSGSQSFRDSLDSALKAEAYAAINKAKKLSESLGLEPQAEKPKPRSRKKAKAHKFTHAGAIAHVLKSSGKEMNKRDIAEALKALAKNDKSYAKPPKNNTLLTELYNMRERGAVVSSGKRPDTKYSIAKP